jgi:hypothetical protein
MVQSIPKGILLMNARRTAVQVASIMSELKI